MREHEKKYIKKYKKKNNNNNNNNNNNSKISHKIVKLITTENKGG